MVNEKAVDDPAWNESTWHVESQLETGRLSKRKTLSSRWWSLVWSGERKRRCGKGDRGMFEGCGTPGGASSGCGGIVAGGGVGRVGAG